MAVRIPWDKYETAILLDAGLQVKRGEVSRKTAVKTVSALLRERAICKGVEIDEVFRNENGISMQLSALMTAFDKKDGGLTVSKLFLDIIELYRSSPQEFELIIKEAKDLDVQGPLREFCVSDFRQNQEYHIINVQDKGLFPLVTSLPEGWDGMRAVCGVNAGPACQESCFKGISLPCGRRT